MTESKGESTVIDEKVLESFHMMWDNFPERARLIRKDRVVLAVNKAGVAQGMTTGVRCIDTPPKEGHIGCKANLALKEGVGKYESTGDGKRIRFWIPVEGCADVFVHYSIPTEGLLPKPETEG